MLDQETRFQDFLDSAFCSDDTSEKVRNVHTTYNPPICHGDQGAEGIFGEIFSWKSGTATQDLSSWSAQASLSQHSLAWHDSDLTFKNLGLSPLEQLLLPLVPPNAPSPQRLAFVRLVSASTSPSCLPSPSPESPQSMENFLEDFLGEIWRFSARGLGHPRRSVQKIRAEIRAEQVRAWMRQVLGFLAKSFCDFTS